MCLNTARKREKRYGNVGDLLMEIVAALRRDSMWHFSQQSKDDRDVMWCKAPEDVFLTSNFAEVQAIGIDVLNAPEFTAIDQVFELQNCRVIPQQMPNHKDAPLLLCQRCELSPLLD